MTDNITLLVTGAMVLVCIIVILWFIITMTIFIKLKSKYEKDNRSLKILQEGNKGKILDYSKQVLEFIRMLVGQVAVIKFRTFVDNNDLRKVTKGATEKLVADVATTVNKSINTGNMSLENTIYSREFFDQYIVDTSVIMIKEMLDKAIGDDQED